MVSMILADIYLYLSRYKDIARHFEACNLLLQLCLIEYLQKVNENQTLCKPTGDDYILSHDLRVASRVKKIKWPPMLKVELGY